MAGNSYSSNIHQFNVGVSPKRTGPGIQDSVRVPNCERRNLSGSLTKHALTEYLDPAKKAFLDVEEKSVDMDNKGEQLFYKLANLDDRIKNADQVS
jgi:hypothetical protein